MGGGLGGRNRHGPEEQEVSSVAARPEVRGKLKSDAPLAPLVWFKSGGNAELLFEPADEADLTAFLRQLDPEVPVMAHLGLTPQSIHKLGGFKVQGRGAEARQALREAALELEAAGAFALVLECVPTALAGEVSARLRIPTIGIGAGIDCDGQVLVYHDLLGLEQRIAPRFVRRYAEQGREAREAIAAFAADVRAGRFPSPQESFEDPTQPASDKDKVGKLYG